MSDIQLLPREDSYNQALINLVHPPDWVNPTPDGKYNLVVIGAGSAGLIAANGAATLGGKVALIEKHFMGGDCLNTGCVPSKAIIRAGRAMGAIHEAGHYGITVPDGVQVDFAAVMRRMRQVRAEIGPHDSAQRYRDLGVDVYFGTGTFTSDSTIEVGGQTLEFSKALIATGSRPATIQIPGLSETGYLTNETVFNLTDLPESLAIIGAGPVGTELAQTFQRLGTDVFLIDISPTILPREDKLAAELVQHALRADGVSLILGATITQVEALNGRKRISYQQENHTGHHIEAAELLLAVGRQANIEGLGLDTVGVAYDERRIIVNDHLQTSNPRIYAAGDVALKHQFTHVAGHTGAIVVQNALFPAPKRRLSDLVIPWVTYTEPEIAHVGQYPSEAEADGIEVDTFMAEMNLVDRAITDGETDGFLKVYVKKGSDQILGATLVAKHAGEIINEITLAMKHKIGLGSLSTVVHPYPTQAEIIGKAAGEYNRTRLTPRVRNFFRWWLKRTR